MLTDLFCPRCTLPLWKMPDQPVGGLERMWCRNMHHWLVVREDEARMILRGDPQ